MNHRSESLSPSALATRFERIASELLRQAELHGHATEARAKLQGYAAGLALAAHDVRACLVRAA